MRTTERLRGLKKWLTENLCAGRELKLPAHKMDCGEVLRGEPKCYLGWAPARLTENGQFRAEADSVCPGILVMPDQAHAKYTEEKRFDRYSNIRRPQELGQHLSVSILFSIYEPGTRLPGFIDSVQEKGMGADMSLILEGTEQGLETLLNWMDDCTEKLLGQKIIPGTDLAVEEDSVTYSLLSDQNYVVDRRPIYYGFINVSFACYAEEGTNPDYEKYLN